MSKQQGEHSTLQNQGIFLNCVDTCRVRRNRAAVAVSPNHNQRNLYPRRGRYTRMSLTISPNTSVSRKSRPA
jgi:hypothetical protein